MTLEKILIVGIAEIIKKLLPILDEHIRSVAWGVRGDLEKLKLSLVTIQAAVSDAEINRVNDQAAILWLRRLEDVVYDADDVMDQYSYQYMRRDEEGSDLKHKVRDLVSFSSSNPLIFRFRIACKIRAINKALDEIHNEYTRYHPEYCSQVNGFSLAKRLRILHPFGLWDTKFSFPSSSKFKHLRFLDLSNCEIDSSHDLSLYHSHNLQTLILHSCSNVSGFLGGIGHLKNLRHLDVSRSDIKALPDDLIIKLTNVQTLDFNGCRKLEALPENIGLLKHLSFLNLSYSSIRKIPDSITCINNLRTLNFMLCWKLDALPRELGALTRLKCLDLRCPAGTGIKVLPESCITNLYNLEIVDFGSNCELPKEIKNWPKLRQFRHSRDYYAVMPGGIEKLTCLETLDSYIVRKEADIQLCGSGGHSGIEELAVLNSLQRLYIKKLENLKGGIEAAERAKLKDKANLRELFLEWSFHRNDEDEEHDDMVLEGLLPHPNLILLQLQGFAGLKLPEWMGSISNCLLLVSLKLENCNNCEKLPALGMLPCLRDLEISGMTSVKYLGREFYYHQEEENSSTSTTTNSSFLFPSLVVLKIFGMFNLEEWVSPPSSSFYVDSYPLLEKLYMQDCPKLRSIPKKFPSLKVLRLIRTSGKAVNSILSATRGGRYLTSLTSIDIHNSPELIYLPLGALVHDNTPNLYSLEISNCSEFQGFRDDDDDDDDLNNNCSNSSLQRLELSCCPVLTSLPDLRLWTSLRELILRKCDRSKDSIPYDLKTSLSFLDTLNVDFI